ncbi:MAG: TetR/AcrR family transcriptional regulator [Treponema sp.]|nr:TetR/AcrR family transcriptional regulator [Treponema sp.]
MRNANPDIIPMIKEKTLNLLMEKNPEAIGMRDIAKACGITATTIYHYYTDKDGLFQAIGLDCLLELNRRIINEVQKHQETREQILSAIGTFRDWSFENPRRALLIMQGIKSTENASPNVIEQFYTCNRTGENLLKKAVAEGRAVSENPRLDVGVLVSGVWGCIESVLLKKSDVEYWENGRQFTDHLISIWMKTIFKE